MTPLGFLSATAVLYANQLRLVARSRRLWVSIALSLLPVAAASVIVQFAERYDGAPPALSIGWILQVQVIVPILALILGSSVVAEEIDDRTLTFPFTRPIPRPALLWGRWLASATVLSVLLAASTLVTLAILRAGFADYVPTPEELENLGREDTRLGGGVTLPLLFTVLLGGLAYSALFAAIGTWMRHPMILGLGYTFAIEGFVANLPGNSQTLTIQHYLRSLVAAYGSPQWRQLAAFQNAVFESGPEALVTLGAVIALSLFGGSWMLARRQYVLPA